MRYMRGLRPVVVVMAGLAFAACGTLRSVEQRLFGEPESPDAGKPEYQPGLEYLPVRVPQGPSWMVRAYADTRAGSQLPTLVWYAKPDLMLRTEGGRIVGARGFARTLHWLDANGCPSLASYHRLTQPATCVLVRNSDSAFGQRQQIRIDPPRLLAAGWQGIAGPLLLVREKPLDGDIPGNYFIFNPQGELLFSRQWIASDFWLDMRAAEGQGGRIAMPAYAEPAAAEAEAPAPVSAPVEMQPVPATAAPTTAAPVAAQPDPVELPAAPALTVAPVSVDAEPATAAPASAEASAPVAEPAAEPTTAPATNTSAEPATAPAAQDGREIPWQPPGFVRRVR